jgi:hypothetical protein
MDILLGRSVSGTLEAKVELELGKTTSTIVVTAHDEGEDELEEAITGMYRTLAWLGLIGEVNIYFDGSTIESHSDEEAEAVDAVLRRLYGESGPTITSEDVARVHHEVGEEEDRIAGRFGTVIRHMNEEGLRRRLNKEVREKMTVEDALRDDEE